MTNFTEYIEASQNTPLPLGGGAGGGALSLHELNSLVRGIIDTAFEDALWVQGELSEARQGYGGHFYGELVQKSDNGKDIIARARINCWANRYPLVARNFERETGERLRAGLKVLLLVHVTFHENYGYSLNIQDIDPTYTLGDMAQRRQQILRQLEQDGILHDNQTLPFPTLCQRIAVISSETAAGYGDFCQQLLHNAYGLRFHLQLFPAVMQGGHVEESVIAALMAIADEADRWDAVVIIRGGGATSDLSDFDSYPLASCIAQFPLPVLTGIGHERDETVLDFVAHTRLKTPTAVAAFLVEHMHQTALHLEDLHQRITTRAHERIRQEKQHLERLATRLSLCAANVRRQHEPRLYELTRRIELALHKRLQNEQSKLTAYPTRLAYPLQLRLERERSRLSLLEQRTRSLDPALLLQRGYSMTLCNGRLIRSAKDVCPGNLLTTRLKEGTITSIVEEYEQQDKQ